MKAGAGSKRDFGSASPKSSTAPDLSLLMPFILGKKKTNELLFTGDKINAQEALSLGLINKIIRREDLNPPRASWQCGSRRPHCRSGEDLRRQRRHRHADVPRQRGQGAHDRALIRWSRADLVQDDLVAVGPQLADRLVTDRRPDGAAFAVPASPSAADAGAPAVSVVKKKLFVFVPFERVLVKFRQEPMGQA